MKIFCSMQPGCSPPAPPAPVPPDPVRLQQEQTGLRSKEAQDQEAVMHDSQTWFIPRIVSLALHGTAFCGYVTDEVDRDAAAEMGAQHAHTHKCIGAA